MEKFKLSENIDPNKVFIVNRSELIGKLSPNIYANNFHFKSKIYPVFKLADLAFINPTTRRYYIYSYGSYKSKFRNH